MDHPFEKGARQERSEARPLPCPECQSTRGYSRVGNFRAQCLECNALLKNAEVNMQLPTEE